MTAIPDASILDMVDESPAPRRAQIAERTTRPLDFFGFQEYPFADSVNPEFFYRTSAHEAAFMAMKRCIEENISLGLTTAPSGTGKTLLTQVLLQELDPKRYRTALVLIYPRMSRTALLQEICQELGIEVLGARPTTHKLIGAIQQEIMELYLQGIKLVLIIDEVHFLTADNLQVLRTLSNIEVPERKLVTVLLFGENCFLPKLENPTFKSILSRMYTRVQLRPLEAGEIAQYIKYRLLLARGRANVFDPDCFEMLHEATEGVPREVNRLCHNALQVAASRGSEKVTPELLQECL